MPVIVPALGLAYFPVPKNACTSLKRLFFEMNEGRPFAPVVQPDGQALYIHDMPGYLSLAFRPGFEATTRGRARLAVIRHPFRRLVSAYKNRVLHHWELSREVLGAEALARAGLPPNPPFDLFLERFEEYRALHVNIAHHTLPQRHFLGPSLALYEHLHRFEEMPRLQALLERLAGGRPVALPHVQSGGRERPDPPLTPETLRRMREVCAPDLEYLAAHYDAG